MKLSHVRLLVTEFTACFRFYRDVMGFAVADVDEAVARLKAQQVEILNEPLDYPQGDIRVAHFRDPSGNLIEINQPLSVA